MTCQTVQWGLSEYGPTLTREQVMELCGGISADTLARYVRERKLPRPIRRGQYPTESVMRYLAGIENGARHEREDHTAEDGFDWTPSS